MDASKRIALSKPNELFKEPNAPGCFQEVSQLVNAKYKIKLTLQEFQTYWQPIYEKDLRMFDDITSIRASYPKVSVDELRPYVVKDPGDQDVFERVLEFMRAQKRQAQFAQK